MAAAGVRIWAALAFVALIAAALAPAAYAEGPERLDIVTATGVHKFEVEIAKDEAARAHGLMNRRYMALPSGSSQCPSPEHPVSCIEPGLAICFTYDNLHVSVPFSHIILPSPFPTESK